AVLSGRLAFIPIFFLPKDFPMARRHSPQHHRPVKSPGRPRTRVLVEALEDQRLLSNSQWLAVFTGISPGATQQEQTQHGADRLHSAGLLDQDVRVVDALDLSGTLLLETPEDVSQPA